MIRCAIFDADGTLLDSMAMWRDITYEYSEAKGIFAPEGLHRILNRLSMEQCADYYRQLGASGSREQVMKELADWALRGYRERVMEKPHAVEFLRLLRKNGTHIAVATASYGDGVAAALERLGILSCVELLVSCTELGTSKEQPDIFLHCTEHFGCTPGEAVVFEDSAYALRTAKDAGFATVAIEDPISMEPGGAEELSGCSDRCISDYGELIRELTPP